MFAIVGASRVPIAVSIFLLFCCSLSNSNTLYFSTNSKRFVSSDVGTSWFDLFLSAFFRLSIPSLCGMFVYRPKI
jgi:hypothetical protein